MLQVAFRFWPQGGVEVRLVSNRASARRALEFGLPALTGHRPESKTSIWPVRSYPFFGNTTVNVVPSPKFEVTVILPLWALTTSLTMNKPKPRLVDGL